MINRGAYEKSWEIELKRLSGILYQIRKEKRITLQQLPQTGCRLNSEKVEKIELGIVPLSMADLFHLSRCYDKKIHIELID